MSDRGPYGADPDPTEAFPPLRDDPTPTPPADLPPIGSDRDPDPTRVDAADPGRRPDDGDAGRGGPYDPGPPYGGPPGGGRRRRPYEPPFEPEPEPWYRQPGPLAALIAGLAARRSSRVIALIVWTGDDDGGISGETLPSVASTSSTTTSSTVPATTTIEHRAGDDHDHDDHLDDDHDHDDDARHDDHDGCRPTTTTAARRRRPPRPRRPLAPTTQPPPPPGSRCSTRSGPNPDLATFADALACTSLDDDVLTGAARTVLAPTNEAFEASPFADPCANPDATEPVLLLHLVSVDLTFAADLQRRRAADARRPRPGRPRTRRRSGPAPVHDHVERDIRAGDGILQVVDGIIAVP